MDAYDFIRNAILEGDYVPGQRLTEEALADELSLSRTPIREAIKRLESEGLVTSVKRGVAVRTFSRTDIEHIYDLRALIEGYAAAQAAFFRAAHDLIELERINQQYKNAIHHISGYDALQIKEIVRLNNKFHEKVMTASQNGQIPFLVSKVVVLPLVFRSFHWYDKQEMIRSCDDHETILNAIQGHDPERAKSATLEHIYKGRDHVLRHLTSIEHIQKEEEA